MAHPELSALLRKGRSRRAEATLAAAEPGALVLAVTERDDGQRVIARTLRVSGQWRVNDRGEISFWAARPDGGRAVVHFGSGWRVTRRNAIELSLGRERATLSGDWEITDAHTLRYRVSGGPRGTMEFRGSFGSGSLSAKAGQIRFELGAGLSRGRRTRTVTLFGAWKLSRTLGLSFELDAPGRPKQSLRFKAEFGLSDRSTMHAMLVSRSGKPLGIELLFTYQFTW